MFTPETLQIRNNKVVFGEVAATRNHHLCLVLSPPLTTHETLVTLSINGDLHIYGVSYNDTPDLVATLYRVIHAWESRHNVLVSLIRIETQAERHRGETELITD